MPTGTTYVPVRVADFESSKLNYNAQGVKSNPTLNTATNVDLYLADDHMITGFWIVVSNATAGDKINLQVIDTDNVMGFGAGTMLKQFATNIYMASDFNQQFDVAYPAKVFGGMSLRIVYTSVAILGGTPFFAINYKLHKILV